jgi:hypothetical protein
VFAVPAPRRQTLEKWNLTESQQVLEWMTEGELRGWRTVLRQLLEDRFGALPEALTARIEAAADLERLRAAVLQASRLDKIDDLQL